jgi:hypothetical protein
MTTAAIEIGITATADTSTSSTPWWCRRDPYVLAPLVLVHAPLASPLVFRMVSAPGAPFGALDELFMGFVFAQCLLLGIWAALGCLPLLVRWALVSGSFLLGYVSIVFAMRHVMDSSLIAFGLIGAMLVTIFAALLLPLRGLLAWRLDFDASRHAPVTGQRGQISFMHLAAFSLAIAAPLAIVRLFAESSPDIDSRALVFGLVAMPTSVLASACPAAYFLLARRRLPRMIAGSMGWCALMTLVHFLLSLLISDLNFFGGKETWLTSLQEITAFHAGIAACVIPTFTALRLAGMKLFALPYAEAASAYPCHPRSSAASLPTASTLPKAA